MFMDCYKVKLKKYFEIIELLSDTHEDNEIYESVLKVLQKIIDHEIVRLKKDREPVMLSRNSSDNEDLWLTTPKNSSDDESVSYFPPGAYDDILEFDRGMD